MDMLPVACVLSLSLSLSDSLALSICHSSVSFCELYLKVGHEEVEALFVLPNLELRLHLVVEREPVAHVELHTRLDDAGDYREHVQFEAEDVPVVECLLVVLAVALASLARSLLALAQAYAVVSFPQADRIRRCFPQTDRIRRPRVNGAVLHEMDGAHFVRRVLQHVERALRDLLVLGEVTNGRGSGRGRAAAGQQHARVVVGDLSMGEISWTLVSTMVLVAMIVDVVVRSPGGPFIPVRLYAIYSEAHSNTTRCT